ncbi:MAG: hypothetical protein KatS3mg127_1913 [Silanimonas sp.]|nr:MAG: hypothetical protein KatS3mg127_1913 [Silanimonas sp.]
MQPHLLAIMGYRPPLDRDRTPLQNFDIDTVGIAPVDHLYVAASDGFSQFKRNLRPSGTDAPPLPI